MRRNPRVRDPVVKAKHFAIVGHLLLMRTDLFFQNFRTADFSCRFVVDAVCPENFRVVSQQDKTVQSTEKKFIFRADRQFFFAVNLHPQDVPLLLLMVFHTLQ